jgi:large subunit ribosomal protein L17
MLRNMVTSLILNERILTTHTKAKYCQKYMERMISCARFPNKTTLEKASSFVKGNEALKKLFEILGERYKYRPGSCSRILHAKNRRGDNASLSILELIDRKDEIRPAIICTPQTYLEAERMRKMNDIRQKNDKF